MIMPTGSHLRREDLGRPASAQRRAGDGRAAVGRPRAGGADAAGSDGRSTAARLRREDVSRSEDWRRTANASAVLQAALDHGPVARSTIARLAGLSPAAVSRLCADLAAAGLLREVPEVAPPKGVGRPHVPVDVDTGRRVACGLHIAVRYATLALVDLRGRVIAREQLDHQPGGPEQVLRRIARRIPEFIAGQAGGRVPLGLGVASGGWVDRGDGLIMENAPLGWRGVPVRELLAAATGLPVYVDSHSRALARAEQMFGDVRARASVVHLFVGNVVDAAFATGGTVHHGPRSAAGAVAHLPLADRADPCACGRRGCLQAAVSDRALGQRAAAAGITPGPAFLALLTAARAGDRRALRLFRERARLVGAAAALLLDVLNPELLVVTEAGAIYLPECLDELRAEVKARSRLCRDPGHSIVATSFGEDALPVAASAVLLDAVYDNPLRRRRPAMPQAS
jgi:predicted NBD/HSP70 family sugar kinase